MSPGDAGGLVSRRVGSHGRAPRRAAGGCRAWWPCWVPDRCCARRGDTAGCHLAEVARGELEPATTPSLRPIGELPQRGPGHAMVGAMPVLGAPLGPGNSGAIADVAEEFCDRQARSRGALDSLAVRRHPRHRAERSSSAALDWTLLGLAVDVADPASRCVACAGSTGCPSSFTDTQRDGRAMVEIAAQKHGAVRSHCPFLRLLQTMRRQHDGVRRHTGGRPDPGNLRNGDGPGAASPTGSSGAPRRGCRPGNACFRRPGQNAT